MDLRQRKLYHQVTPTSEQQIYNEFNQPTFLISVGSGRSLVKNSVRILGDVRVLNAGAQSTGGRLFNRNAGAHVFFDAITTSFSGGQGRGSVGGQIENLTNYSRWVAMNGVGSLNELDMLNAENQCELRAVTNAVMADYGSGITPTNPGGTPLIQDPDFSLKPEICLNRMSGGDLPFDKSGIVTVMTSLARNAQALFGANQDVNTTYELRNLRCTYMSVPDSKTPEPTVMNVEYPIKSNILTGTATLSTNIPAVCSGVSINFIQTQHFGVNVFDSNRLENPAQLQSVQYIMNDKTNSLITHKLEDQTEILENFVDSLYNSGRNQVSLDKFRSNNAFGCGLSFDGGIDLSSNRFTFQIVSGINNTYPCNVYQYFHSSVSL
tara:strand:- start:1920 stop:3056 length:1137 start_codon:yes stop_codon:yes gene_type:complete